MTIAARTNVTSARVSGLTNGVSYDVRVRACAGAVCGDWSTPAGGTPQPAPTVSIASPFVGQEVTLTAPYMSSQTAASYQWQAWSHGAWANQGGASASSTLSVSSNTAKLSAYRVIVTYGAGAAAPTATSSAVLVEWKPVVIDVTADNPFPVTTGGTAGDRTVTLTAGGRHTFGRHLPVAAVVGDCMDEPGHRVHDRHEGRVFYDARHQEVPGGRELQKDVLGYVTADLGNVAARPRHLGRVGYHLRPVSRAGLCR